MVLLGCVGCDDALDAFYRVRGLCGSVVEVDGHRALGPTLDLELRVVCHALYWEADPGDVERSCVDPFTNNLDELFKSSSDPICGLLVEQLVAASWTGVWASVVTGLL